MFVRGEGSRVFDADGAAYLDFGAGILTQAVGHCHPHVTAAVQAQVARLTNIHDSDTPERARLCAMLAAVLPPHLSRFAFFTTGAEAVEAAIRAVHAAAPAGRTVIAALKGGFHGKTSGARALVNWRIGTEPAAPARQFPAPHCRRCPLGLDRADCGIACAHAVADAIAESDDLAALVFEPVQAAGGVIVPPDGYWPIVAAACRAKGVLLVADEIVTGGGRTGRFLASERYGIEPDLVLAAKGLGSGIPFSMLAGREALMTARAFAAPGATSSTFGGNPVSCAAVIATLEVLAQDDVIAGVPALGDRLGAGLAALASDHPALIEEVRGIGLLHAIEFAPRGAAGAARATDFYRRCLDLGVRVGLGGNIARLAPPLNIAGEDIDVALAAFARALATMP
jgi:4-aminobutyrate aminotransferase/(S)-3-amino-2-methylpropionate transaminase